jgi:hypothetical protein
MLAPTSWYMQFCGYKSRSPLQVGKSHTTFFPYDAEGRGEEEEEEEEEEKSLNYPAVSIVSGFHENGFRSIDPR